MRDRIVFYNSRLVAGQIGKGKEYKLKRVITIHITDYTLILESPEYNHRFTFYDHRNKVEFTNIVEIRTLELPKIPPKPDVYLWNWLRFFRAETKEELNMIATASPAIQQATARVMMFSEDERARMIYEAELIAEFDEQSRLNAAREAGREEERKVGEAALREKAITFARKMLKRNRPIAEIVEDTGLSLDEIKNLAY